MSCGLAAAVGVGGGAVGGAAVGAVGAAVC
jgi:hypothetical protein